MSIMFNNNNTVTKIPYNCTVFIYIFKYLAIIETLIIIFKEEKKKKQEKHVNQVFVLFIFYYNVLYFVFIICLDYLLVCVDNVHVCVCVLFVYKI